MKGNRNLVFILLTGILFACLFYFYGGHGAPKGQQPLVTLDQAKLQQLRSEFNGFASQRRVLVLLSPT